LKEIEKTSQELSNSKAPLSPPKFQTPCNQTTDHQNLKNLQPRINPIPLSLLLALLSTLIAIILTIVIICICRREKEKIVAPKGEKEEI